MTRIHLLFTMGRMQIIELFPVYVYNTLRSFVVSIDADYYQLFHTNFIEIGESILQNMNGNEQIKTFCK